jgi:hypothetical protein
MVSRAVMVVVRRRMDVVVVVRRKMDETGEMM